ncbi:3463_t:CDS:2, partial [Racocetra fulgida]
MSKKVKDYLKAFFTAADEIPKVNTVELWIARYSHLVHILAAEERQIKSHTSDLIQAEAIESSKNKHEIT